MSLLCLDSAMSKGDLVLVTGGNGFIGSHVANRLNSQGYKVRIADIAPTSSFAFPICSELLVGNLCDRNFCYRATFGVAVVLHFAATMGGMGVIHSANDFRIYSENHSMTLNLLQASVESGVNRFLLASSACVYPDILQKSDEDDVALRESDVLSHPPAPQGLYGLEKLVSEFVLVMCQSKLEIRIARFHNVYGPGGAWKTGHEKAPAALLRKAIAVQRTGDLCIELWGNGQQRRSFLFIDDAVQAIVKLLASDCQEAVNIGSDDAVTIKELAKIALEVVGVDVEAVEFHYDELKPVGVAARNSDNTFVKASLGWTPTTRLVDGMRKTAEWMNDEVDRMTCGAEDEKVVLASLQKSLVVDLQHSDIIFAIVLPITSRGSSSPESCLIHLEEFVQSLERTTWRDTHPLGGGGYNYKVYLAIDRDDGFLLAGPQGNKAEVILRKYNVRHITTILCDHPKGYVCWLWRDCVREAWNDGCDYFVLMGDDVVLKDEGWMRDVHAEFSRLAKEENVPVGFGCVTFTDVSFPGMPTFPIIHRTHLDIFHGEVIPDSFVNQDGDPYLYQLYRRWGCSSMIPARLSNEVGGSEGARYEKHRAVDWTFSTLDEGTCRVEEYLKDVHVKTDRKLTLDVIIPSYRVQLPLLDGILSLRPSNTCTVMFIIIIDDPRSPCISALLRKYDWRPDVRIRINKINLGASASRNRGMQESAAEWAIFLDDDVAPDPHILEEAEKIIRSHPKAAGFVGNVKFPLADSIFTTAVHLAGVTYFWNIAEKWDLNKANVPWGVTANLIARRNVMDGVSYNLVFPKTGGGEDIDFCLRKHRFSVEHGGEGFYPAPDVTATHPWWNGGSRSYWRFYMWSKGDGELVKLYPELSYFGSVPNSSEMFLALITSVVILTPVSMTVDTLWISILPSLAIISVFLANIFHDLFRHLLRDRDRTLAINSSLFGIFWFMAVLESSLVRMASEAGRTVGMLERNEFRQLGWRFDWFAGRVGSGPRKEEIKNSQERLALSVIILTVLCTYSV